jgi:hypothetical protein
LVHVTWDNDTRDVSNMLLNTAVNAATSTSLFLRHLAFPTCESTVRFVVVAVVDAQEELRADVATTCAVSTTRPRQRLEPFTLSTTCSTTLKKTSTREVPATARAGAGGPAAAGLDAAE